MGGCATHALRCDGCPWKHLNSGGEKEEKEKKWDEGGKDASTRETGEKSGESGAMTAKGRLFQEKRRASSANLPRNVRSDRQ